MHISAAGWLLREAGYRPNGSYWPIAVVQEGASSRTGANDGELEETTLSRLQIWERSNLGKSTLSQLRKQGGI